MLKTLGRSFGHLRCIPRNLQVANSSRRLTPVARPPRAEQSAGCLNASQIMPSIRQTVLEHINNANYQPVKPAVIAKQLGLASEAARELKKTIKQLIKSGELAWG